MPTIPPNIIVFMSDQEQGQVVHPDHPCRTPTAARLAKEGLLFSRCYTPAAHCCPSRASYLTGLYPSHHGIYNNILTHTAIGGEIRPGCRMFSESLREAGWNLGYSGKWHASRTEDPQDRGWEDVGATAVSRDARTPAEFWIRQAEEARRPWDDSPRRRGEIIMPGYSRRLLYGVTDREMEDLPDYKVVMRAIETIERYAKAGRPFFVQCGPTGPHDPYVIPERYARLYDPEHIPLPPNYRDSLDDKPRIYQRQRRQLWSQLSDDEAREALAHYWGYCTMMDDYRKLLYDAVDDLGLRDNTILIFMSDHGDYGAAHGLFCKGVPCFEEGYRVPLIIRWPEGIADPGRTIEEFVTHCDLAPTFLDVARAPRNPTSGASLTPFFHGNEVPGWTRECHTQFNGVELYYTQRAVVTKDYKYVFNGFDFDELYDRTADPYELTNLAENPDYEQVKLDLVRRMWRFSSRENDIWGNGYFTVALAPWGPRVGLTEGF